MVEQYVITRIVKRNVPESACNVKKRKSSHNVCTDECFRSEDRTVNVTFCRKVNYGVYVILPENALDFRAVADVNFFKEIALSAELFLYLRKIFKVSGIRKAVNVYDVSCKARIHKRFFPCCAQSEQIVNEIRTDKSGSSGYKNVL